MSALLRRLLYLLRGSHHDADLRDEIESHRAHRQDALERAGLSPDAAALASRRAIGNVTLAVEDAREVWVMRAVDGVRQDLRIAVRTLRSAPVVTAVAVLSLALAIGANTAIFSLVDAVLWRSLPYPQAEQLVTVDERRHAPEFAVFSQQSRTLEHVAAFQTFDLVLTGNGPALELRGQRISAELLPLLGVTPPLGRAFAAEEFQPAGAHVALISHSLWHRRFGGDPQIVGGAVTLDRRNYTVVGVLPPGFAFFPASDVLTPLAFNAQQLSDVGHNDYSVVARLKTGGTLEQAERELNAIVRHVNPDGTVRLVLLRDLLVNDVRPTLFVLWGVVAVVLLIACANFANLLLARAAARQRALAICAALGAGRGRIVRQLLTESVVLSVLGGALGVLGAYWALHALVAINPAAVPGADVAAGPDSIPRLDEVGLNLSAIAFTSGLSLLTGVLFGLAPALQFSKPDLDRSLKDGAPSANGSVRLWRDQRTRSLLAVSEIALALLLLVGAGLLVRSYWRLQHVEPGYQPRNLLTLQLEIPWSRYRTEAATSSFVASLNENLAALPGVESVGATGSLPLTGFGAFRFYSIEGRMDVDPHEKEDWPFGWSPPTPPPYKQGTRTIHHRTTFESLVSPGYFPTMGIRLLRGRDFDRRDDVRGQRVAIINEAMAQRFWPDGDPLGKRIKLGSLLTSDPWLTIVGVVGNVRHFALDDKPRPEFYRPFPQSNDREGWRDAQTRADFRGTDAVSLVVRTSAPPEAMVETVQKLVASLDRDQPISRVATMEELLADSTAARRFNLLLFGVAAAVAVLLAAVGVYGVMAYLVVQRTHEFGIRLALGAQRRAILRLVLQQGLQLSLLGLAFGLAAAWALTGLVKNLLFGIGATDPLTLAALAVLLTGITLLACFLPARRATRVDPLIALRHE